MYIYIYICVCEKRYNLECMYKLMVSSASAGKRQRLKVP